MNTDLDTPVDDYFRSHLPNQTEAGGRKWLYPRATSGRYTNWRMIVSWVLAFTLDILDTSRPLTLCFPSSVQSVLGEQGIEKGFCSIQR
ncbi:MAG: hypothetical protein EOO39_30845 [Cytophagaceae bacterium]|nr:MAG: hypothetical protein EOO39_30845 [Cytophagaceae bacterium]